MSRCRCNTPWSDLAVVLLCMLCIVRPLSTAWAQEPTRDTQTECFARSVRDMPMSKCEPRALPGTEHVPDVASLKTPESPAFLVLGYAASEIQRPSAPTTFKLSASAGVGESDAFSLLQSFAGEVSPFRSRPLKPEEVVEETWEALYRNVSFSFATGPKDVQVVVDERTTKAMTLGRLAIGARTTLLSGSPTRGAERCSTYLRTQIERREADAYDPSATFKSEWEHDNPEPSTDSERRAWMRRRGQAIEAFNAKLDVTFGQHEHVDETFERCTLDIYAREGFMADIAGAYMISAPEGELDPDSFATITTWLTIGWVKNLGSDDAAAASSELSVLALGRHQYDYGSAQAQGDRNLTFDLGGRVAYAVSRYGVAGEVTHRIALSDPEGDVEVDDQHAWRVALSVDYRLDNGLWFIGTFGRAFGVEQGNIPIIGLANVQWNFDLDRGVRVDRKVTQ